MALARVEVVGVPRLSPRRILLAHWNSKDLVALPEMMSVALGVRPSALGSSGTFERKQSNASLKCSMSQFFKFLTFRHPL